MSELKRPRPYVPAERRPGGYSYMSTSPGPVRFKGPARAVPETCPSCAAPPEDSERCLYCGRLWPSR